VTSSSERERLEADACYYRDRVALLRAKLYRWGLAPTARLKELERSLARAEQRVREHRSRESR
jgi:hypothetical protein